MYDRVRCVLNVCGALAADVRRGGHARFGREGAGVQEANPDVHRTHAGGHVPGGQATEHGAVPRLGESFGAWAKLNPVRNAPTVSGGQTAWNLNGVIFFAVANGLRLPSVVGCSGFGSS